MQDIKTLNQQRAEIYWWLSGVFNAPLSGKELTQYHSNDIRQFLTGLAQNRPLAPAVMHLLAVLDQQHNIDRACSALAAQFRQLFLTSGDNAARPCASAYPDANPAGAPVRAEPMTRLLQRHGVTIPASQEQPADHLAVELDFLGHLIMHSNELERPTHMEQALAEQADFIQQRLMNWVPQFVSRCQRLDETRFYAATGELLIAFLKLDLNYLLNE